MKCLWERYIPNYCGGNFQLIFYIYVHSKFHYTLSMTLIIDVEIIRKNTGFSFQLNIKRLTHHCSSLCMSYDIHSSIILHARYILLMEVKGVTTKKAITNGSSFIVLTHRWRRYLYISCLLNWNFHYTAWNIKRHKTAMWWRSIQYSGGMGRVVYGHQERAPRVMLNKLITALYKANQVCLE